ncbi:unnamed protein product [Rotaria sordida]|uniref:HTH TFE/IIEalpha-type domain-containing protein n=1 Tax=Rotaria sordida TaxID=392033 RepID=A0A813YU76_9BILA|nr:unnamed protein product [Rotaria sordida]CAF0879104.1 unnamed protein product [Rotaria sordida]CAF0888840.1 unnamed protein product [Rotaria sordida]CAF1063389.1 unnamed protein product [Rotaria sordida]CAF1235450.1 unnamed protein product [Rotaria sordida]
MSSISAGGGSFTNLNPSLPQQPTRSNPQINPSTTNSITSSSNEIPLPTYDTNEPRAILKALIRFIMRTFYDIPKSLVIEYIYHHERIKQQDLADRLFLDPKQVRSYIQEFKRDKFIIEDHRLESNDSTTGRRNQDQYYYKIDTTTFINVVKYRLVNMQTYVENLERQQTYKQSNYKCEQCSKEYTELDIKKLYDSTQDTLICLICGGNVHEDIETKETTTTANRQTANMSLFNEQMKPLFEILERIDDIMTNDQQMKTSSDQDIFQQNGNLSTLNHHINKEIISTNTHRSQASTVFDRTATLNHDIQIIIEKDDDDHYSQMDIDETSNTTDSIISSSRGPGKPGKKSTKSIQSIAEVATQPLTTKMKLTNKKIPYEPKPLPHWFVRSTVYVDQDEEHRLNNSSLNSTTHSSNISRQLSNQKLMKSTTIHDIKQMLLVHESRRKKALTLTTMEDSSSPPTPLQMTKTTDSQ